MSSNNIDVGKIFNKFAPVFNKVSNQYTMKRRYQKASSFSKGKLLDIGGASGLFFSFLNSDIQPILLDISYNMCLEAKLNHGANVVCADAEKLPFPDNSFDTVVSLETIYYLDKPLNLVIEVERVLRSNGVFVLSFYNSRINFLVSLRSALRRFKLGGMFF